MPREKENYRDTLMDILEFTGGKRILNVSEVMRFTGATRTVLTRRYTFKNYLIEAERLAREMS